MLYGEVVDRVKNGSRFNICFEERSVSVDGIQLNIENTGVPKCTLDEALKLIELHYINYKKSVPSERNDSRRRRYFKADKMIDLSDEELCTGEQREVAQAELEMLVLGLILNGSLYWDNKVMGGNWFWRSKNYPELILLKDWIEREEN